MKKKSKITADLKKNRLQISLIGALTVSDLQEIYTDIRFCVADLKPGFDIITDFRGCKIGHLAGLGTFAKIREHLQKSGAGTAIRIAGKGQLIFHQISKIAAKNSNYRIIYVKDMEEAEAMLTETDSQIETRAMSVG